MLVPIFGLLLNVAAVAERPNLTGIVRSSDDKPLAAAMVFIYTARPRTGSSTTCPSCYLDCRKRAQTDAKGAFAIPSVDPTLLFRIGAMAEGYQASFQSDVDPAAGPVTIRLSPQPPLPDNPRRVFRGRIVDGSGAPVMGAFVEPVGFRIDHPDGAWEASFGSIGVPPAITGPTGRLSLAIPREVDSLFLQAEARGLAPKVFGRVPTGGQENQLHLGVGRSIRGRLIQDGRPLSGVVIGTAQVSKNAETFVGERTAETDASGRFMLLNLPPDETLVVYGKIDGLGGRSALAEREIQGEADGAVRDLGDLALEPGIALSGRVVLADGKPIPPHTRIMLSRLRAFDTSEQELTTDGGFGFASVPRETVELSIRLPQYELSTQNESLLPDSGDSRVTLAGRLEQDTQLRIVLEPAGGRKRAEPPRSAEEWSVLKAQQDAVRSKPLRGAPPVR